MFLKIRAAHPGRERGKWGTARIREDINAILTVFVIMPFTPSGDHSPNAATLPQRPQSAKTAKNDCLRG
jgi:hypothetical protein